MTSRKVAGSKRAQKYQNSTAYKPSRYGETRQMKLAAALPLAGICPRCKEKIEWKRKYGKYKPLTAPKKCIFCQEKKVKQAYYRLCQDCAESRNVCAKCGEQKGIVDGFPASEKAQAKEEAEFRRGLKVLSERERRKVIRKGITKTINDLDSSSSEESECCETTKTDHMTTEMNSELTTEKLSERKKL